MLLNDANFLALVKKGKQISQATNSNNLNIYHLLAAIEFCFEKDDIPILLAENFRDWDEFLVTARERLGLNESTNISNDEPPKLKLTDDLRLAIEATQEQDCSAFITQLCGLMRSSIDETITHTQRFKRIDKSTSNLQAGKTSDFGNTSEAIEPNFDQETEKDNLVNLSKPSASTSVTRNVFISFKNQDRFYAEFIYDGLVSKGMRCWISSRDIPPGTNFMGEIPRAIKNCGAVILVFSDAAQQSPEIPRELALASQNRKPIIPVRIEPVEPNETFAYTMATAQFLDAFDDWSKNGNRYVENIEKAVLHHLGSITANSTIPSPGNTTSNATDFTQPSIWPAPSKNIADSTSAINSLTTTIERSPPEGNEFLRPEILEAVEAGRELRARGANKWEASNEIFGRIGKEKRNLVIDALIKGADCTADGAATYYQKLRKEGNRIEQNSKSINELLENSSPSSLPEDKTASQNPLERAPNLERRADEARDNSQNSYRPQGQPQSIFSKLIFIFGISIFIGIFGYQFVKTTSNYSSTLASSSDTPKTSDLQSAINSDKHTDLGKSSDSAKPGAGNITCTELDDCLKHSFASASIEDVAALRILASKIANLPKPERGNRQAARRFNTDGLFFLQSGQIEAAIAHFVQGNAQDPLDVELAANLGLALTKAGRATEAFAILREALVIDPRRASTWVPLGEALALLGRKDEALAALWIGLQWTENRERAISFYAERAEKEREAAPVLSELYAAMLSWAKGEAKPDLRSISPPR
jgi:tetratricopeptide (TPR) repeat protein